MKSLASNSGAPLLASLFFGTSVWVQAHSYVCFRQALLQDFAEVLGFCSGTEVNVFCLAQDKGYVACSQLGCLLLLWGLLASPFLDLV